MTRSGATHLCVPRHIRITSSASGATFALNLRSGHWYVLNHLATTLWQEILRTGDSDRAADTLANQHPRLTPEEFRRNARLLFTDLTEQGLLSLRSGVPTAEHLPMIAQSKPLGSMAAAAARPSRWMLFLAHIGLLAAFCLLRLPFHLTFRIVGALTSRWCARATSQSEALVTVAAVEAAADRYPGRAACLERSLGCVITAALSRQGLRWVIGVAEDPCRFHAWVETDGIAVTRSPAPHIDTFTRVLST
ncbi:MULTISPECIES: lasso peptide biosynthesis B2 protein [unclassified Crossiella]|uniref:lasso peptide biosynthesis B2 protein n=1 Tax=unclassified Crossiella TaxID=2620835 RepID=UPI001FFEBD1B|nr:MULTISPECIES: lasso peptide biosynthesis B2 protein [unclassified Crossiella]MCK2242516.1 lasso peptide biosynthesis B2 protein [Crossiella sp. S99.2]MCK2254454.1 lasso peptide biosynthesis B2 protein [Crossiella sp. S99.1]